MSSGDFVGIAVQEFTLKELSMTGELVEGTELRFLLPSGSFKTAVWGEVYTDEDGTDLDEMYIGWYDAVTFNAIDYTFKPGEGFFVKPTDLAENPKLVSSGALYTSDATLARIGVALTPNFQEITSNPMPGGTFNLDDITMTGELVEGTELRFLLPSGSFKTAVWGEVYTDEDGNDLDEMYIGWYDAVTFNAIHYTFKSGESYFVKPTDLAENPYISYPNPLYVAPAAN